MRKLNDHVVTEADALIEVTVTDEAGHGGAQHSYLVTGPDFTKNPSNKTGTEAINVLFQNGPVTEFGNNGLTNEILIEIVMDRLRSFQAGDFACRENALALTKLEEALHWLQQRTLARVRRGVEGKNVQ